MLCLRMPTATLPGSVNWKVRKDKTSWSSRQKDHQTYKVISPKYHNTVERLSTEQDTPDLACTRWGPLGKHHNCWVVCVSTYRFHICCISPQQIQITFGHKSCSCFRIYTVLFTQMANKINPIKLVVEICPRQYWAKNGAKVFHRITVCTFFSLIYFYPTKHSSASEQFCLHLKYQHIAQHISHPHA